LTPLGTFLRTLPRRVEAEIVLACLSITGHVHYLPANTPALSALYPPRPSMESMQEEFFALSVSAAEFRSLD